MNPPISHETRLALVLFSYVAGLFVVIQVCGHLLGFGSLPGYLALAVAFVAVENLAGPSLIERVMKVNWSDDADRTLVLRQLAARARIPMPRFGVSLIPMANAFAFGRTKRDGRVCVTDALQQAISTEELDAVLAHEVSHIKHWDTTVIALLSVVPMLAEALLSLPRWLMRAVGGHGLWSFPLLMLAFGVAPALWMFYALLLPVSLLSRLLLFYASRISEMNADLEATRIGAKPEILASALFQLALLPKAAGPSASNQGSRALLLSNPLPSFNDLAFARSLDPKRKGRMDMELFLELADIRLTLADCLAELLRSHPLMARRMRQLARVAVDEAAMREVVS